MFSKKYNQLFHESHSWRKLTVFENVEVTPELANDLLRLNDGNRPVKDATLKRYINDMKKGNWVFNGDSVRVSKTGKLLDGQHRLMAIVHSGCSQIFNIQSGLENESFETMDTGKLRSQGDTLAVLGFKNPNVMAGAIRLAAQYTQMKIRKDATMYDRFTMNNKEIADWVEKHGGDRMEECSRIASNLYSKARFLSISNYAGLLYILGNKNWEEAKLFFEMLSTGENMSSSKYSMVWLLRQKLINMAASRMQFKNTYEKVALVIKSWNYFREGKEIKQLSWQSDKEPFPMAV